MKVVKSYFPRRERSSFRGLPQGEDKKEREGLLYEKHKVHRGLAGTFTAAGWRRDGRRFEQGYAAVRRNRYGRRQAAPGRQVSRGMDRRRTNRGTQHFRRQGDSGQSTGADRSCEEGRAHKRVLHQR